MDITDKIDEALDEGKDSLSDGIDVKSVLEDLRKAEINMKDLAGTVNILAKSRKVRAEDYIEPIEAAVSIKTINSFSIIYLSSLFCSSRSKTSINLSISSGSNCLPASL